MDAAPPVIANIQSLLESSVPRPRSTWMIFVLGAGLMGLLSLSAAADKSPSLQGVVVTLSMMLFLGCLSGANLMTARRRRQEQSRIEAAEELVQLKHWPQAAQILQAVLSRPTTNPVARLQALVYLSSVLARFERFDDVTMIADHVLETIPLDAPAVHQVKLGRGMALLRQDRLYDADRAISDLRHSPQAAESPGLALLEMYRDVKTGHPTEALDTHAAKLEMIRRQAGHRVADAYVLAAAAHNAQGGGAEAQADYQRATMMAPAAELHRRYPETGVLASACTATPAPPDIAQGAG